MVYNGSVNTTVSGLNCLPWAAEAGSSQEDHSHVLNEHHNFCRGVDTRSGRPWCYVDLEDSQLSERHVGVRDQIQKKIKIQCSVIPELPAIFFNLFIRAVGTGVSCRTATITPPSVKKS